MKSDEDLNLHMDTQRYEQDDELLEKIEFFYEPTEKGYYLESDEGYYKKLDDFNIPQDILEEVIKKVNEATQNTSEKPIPAVETMYDYKVNTIAKIGIVFIFVFFLFTIIHVYFTTASALFYTGFLFLFAGLMLFLILICFNGNLRMQRSSVLVLPKDTREVLFSVVGKVLMNENPNLQEYKVRLKLNALATKLYLVPIY